MIRTLFSNVGLIALIILCGIQVVLSMDTVLRTHSSIVDRTSNMLMHGGFSFVAATIGGYALHKLRKRNAKKF